MVRPQAEIIETSPTIMDFEMCGGGVENSYVSFSPSIVWLIPRWLLTNKQHF